MEISQITLRLDAFVTLFKKIDLKQIISQIMNRLNKRMGQGDGH